MLKSIQLSSQQLERVDLLPCWRSGQIPTRASSGSLEISYTGKPGSLVASVTSVDQTGSYVFDAKIDNKLAAGFHGEYWSTEGDNDTSITIKNITQKPATALVSLQYDAGRGEYDMPPMVLQAGESHMIDLKMIQREGMPGASGELLPETAVYGGMKLREEPGGRHFLIDALVFNAKTATCGVCGYGCLYPGSMNIPGGTYIIALADSGEVIAVNAHMCDGTNENGWECVSEFSTDSSAVGTVDPWCQSHGFGISEGSTTIRTVARDVPGPHCGEQTLGASRPMTVVPKADRLKVVSDTGQVALANCPSIITRSIVYQVIDVNGAAVNKTLQAKEVFSNQTTNTCGNGQPPASSCGPTNTAGQIGDTLSITCNGLSGAQSNPSCGFTQNQKIFVCPPDGTAEVSFASHSIKANQVLVNTTTTFNIGTILPK